MSQGIFSSINPNTTSGTQLATILDDFKDAVVSGFSGTSRPTNLNQYGYWIDTTNAGTGFLDYKFWDGTNDITVLTINTNTQTIEFAGVTGNFRVEKVSDDNIGPKLILEKQRATGGGQTLTSDVIGDMDFEGNDASAVTYVMSRIRIQSLDDVSVTERGADMIFSTTPVNGASLAEIMRLKGEGRVGVGNSAPEKTIHAQGTDASAGVQATQLEDSATPPEVILQKKRVIGLGQVLNLDLIGRHLYKSVDQLGAVTDVARVEVEATQDHTDAAQGVSYVIDLKKDNEAAFTEAMRIQNGEVTFFGQKMTNLHDTFNMLSGTNQLLAVDGAVYGAFKAVIYIHGENATITRQQEVVIKGVYDFTNTTWKTQIENDSMGGADAAVTTTVNDAEALTIDYVNQIPTFTSGKIYREITRYLR